MFENVTLSVDLAPVAAKSYQVIVGQGLEAIICAGWSDNVPKAKRIGLISQAKILECPKSAKFVDQLKESVLKRGAELVVLEIGDGEQHKNLSTVQHLTEQLSLAGFTRNDALIALGGGLVSDVVGFTAALYHRGISAIYVPTTLLAMIDAAIGGKTGVNLEGGKNLVGAFWQPNAVYCDLEFLDTMSQRDRASGFGEMAKYHFLDEENGPYEGTLGQKVARSIAIKARIVSQDEREGGIRAILNYGHTLGHALEIASSFEITHGEAVAKGLVFAAILAKRLGRISEAKVEEHKRIVQQYALSWALPEGLAGGDEELLNIMARDKKALSGLTFILHNGDAVELVTDVSRQDVLGALGEFRKASSICQSEPQSHEQLR